MAVTLTVGTNTFITLTDADTYFEARVNAGAWNGSSDDEKKAALVTGYRDLSTRFSFSSTISNAMKYAQCEQSLFRLQDESGIDARAALRSQGVESAGVVKESYASGIGEVPIAPSARGFLSSDGIYEEGPGETARILNVYRDEDED